MPHPDMHAKLDLYLFGKSYARVHKWLDGMFNGTNGRTHWVHRHHLQAINAHFRTEELRRVAIFHLIVDFAFYYKVILFVPENRKAVERFLNVHGTVIEE